MLVPLLAIACGGATETLTSEPAKTDAGKISAPHARALVDESDSGTDARFQIDGALFPDTSVDGAPQFDAGTADPLAFTDQITGVYCARFGSCCMALGLSDSFQNDLCVNSLVDYPYGLFGIPSVFKAKLGAGHLTFDADAAQACLGLIETFSCGNFTSKDWVDLNRQCLSAMKGNIPVGGTGCTSSIECEQPARCDMSGGGATGTCVAHLQSGDACTDNSQCGDGLTGGPRYCSNIETWPFAASGVCQDQKLGGQECHGMPQECLTQLCEPDDTSSTGLRCAEAATFTAPYTCTPYK